MRTVNDMRLQLLLISLLVFGFNFTITSVNAAEQSFSGRSEYLLDKKESVKDGQTIVYREAIRSIVQQAGIYIQASSSVVDNVQNNDVIEALSTAVLKITDKKFARNIDGNGNIKVTVDLRANVDVDLAGKMLAELIQIRDTAKAKKQTIEEYQKKSNQYNELNTKYVDILKQNAKQTVRMGIEQERKGQNDVAMTIYNNLIAEYDGFAMAYSRRGHLYRLQGRDDLATSDYEKAASLDEQDAGWHYGKAVLLDKRGRTAEAVSEYRLFIKYANILDDNPEIIKALERVVELAPEYR